MAFDLRGRRRRPVNMALGDAYARAALEERIFAPHSICHLDLSSYKKTVSATDYPVKDNNLNDQLSLETDLADSSGLGFQFGYKRSTTSGLTIGYYGGTLLVDGVTTAIADGTILLTASQTNYVERDHAGAVTKNIVGFSADKVPMLQAVTGVSTISSVTDKRPANQPPVGLLSLSVAGGAGTTVLTEAQARATILIFTGVLTGNRAIELPNVKRTWLVYNNTTGAFTLTVRVTGQAGFAVTRTKANLAYGNGTDIAKFIDATPVDAIALAGSALGGSSILINGTIVQTRAGNAETIAIKTLAGTDPTDIDPVLVVFRDQAATTGGFIVRTITAALSLVISSGSTLGVSGNNIAFRLWYALFDDAGTVRLAAINCLSGTNIYPLAGWGIASSTAEGGAGAADSAQVFYTGVAVAAKPFIVIGYATWEAGLAAIGTWGTAPSRMQLYGPGVPLPGVLVQLQRSDTGAVATGTTTTPVDDTIPQNTEGDQYMAAPPITPTSAANILVIASDSYQASSAGATNAFIMALHQDAIANALKAAEANFPATNGMTGTHINHKMLAGATAATTFKIRVGSNAAGTTTFNGASASRRYGGTFNSYIEVQELMT